MDKKYNEMKGVEITAARFRNAFLFLLPVLLCAVYIAGCHSSDAGKPGSADAATARHDSLKLPDGFKAVIFADSVGKARHLAVTNKGDIYVKLASLKEGKGIVYLHDSDGDGIADQRSSFGDYGGTGMFIRDSFLYASSNEAVYRYRLNENGKVLQTDHPDTIIKGLIDRHEHNSKSIVLDHKGNIYVNIGAYSNACQTTDRVKGSAGKQPCPILDSAAGIWQFKTNLVNQGYNNGSRYATGFRNVVGLDWNEQDDQLFVMQHGRDQLFQLFPQFYTAQQGAELPAETMYAINKGDNGGWPYIYYDHLKKQKILAPEYGGDGNKTARGKAIDPVMAFPGHMAPDGLLFYTGTMFPEKYRNGAFVAFHGSWNRAPEKQKGYFVAFVPFKNGKPSGQWEIFADNFAGEEIIQAPGDAAHRPCGLAQGPDGALYVSDDNKGTIYRIVYAGK